MDVASARPGQSLSHTVARVIAWLSESGQLCRLRTLALIAKPVNDALECNSTVMAQTAQTVSSNQRRNVGVGGESAPMITVTLCDTCQPAGLSSARQSEAGVWLSVGKVSRLVLCDHRSRVGGVDCGV